MIRTTAEAKTLVDSTAIALRLLVQAQNNAAKMPAAKMRISTYERTQKAMTESRRAAFVAAFALFEATDGSPAFADSSIPRLAFEQSTALRAKGPPISSETLTQWAEAWETYARTIEPTPGPAS